MADEADRANDQAERELEQILKARAPSERRTGFCVWCRARLPGGGVYCDSDCRDDHETFLRAKGAGR